MKNATSPMLWVLVILNTVVLIGQLWPDGAPPFARTVNILFLVLSLRYFVWQFLPANRPAHQPDAWTTVAEYAAVYEAEIDQQQLEEAGIPVLRQSPAPGIFGAGYSGTTTQGVSLRVPTERADAARRLLGRDA